MNLLFRFTVIILFRSQIKVSEPVATRRTSPLKEIERRRCSSPSFISTERGTWSWDPETTDECNVSSSCKCIFSITWPLFISSDVIKGQISQTLMERDWKQITKNRFTNESFYAAFLFVHCKTLRYYNVLGLFFTNLILYCLVKIMADVRPNMSQTQKRRQVVKTATVFPDYLRESMTTVIMVKNMEVGLQTVGNDWENKIFVVGSFHWSFWTSLSVFFSPSGVKMTLNLFANKHSSPTLLHQ